MQPKNQFPTEIESIDSLSGPFNMAASPRILPISGFNFYLSFTLRRTVYNFGTYDRIFLYMYIYIYIQ